MDKQSENFISLISAYLNRTPACIDTPDWEQMYRLAAIHNLQAIMYLSIKNSNFGPDDEVLNRFENAFNITVKYSVVQEYTVMALIKLLNDNQIRHILYKGFVVKDYYPDKELRTMGDVDIIIDEDKQEFVHNLLINAGYVFDEYSSHAVIRNYVKNNVCFEVHTRIVEKDIFDNVDCVGYFADNFKYAVLKNGYTYEFGAEHHLIYLLVHMAKHFKYSGCGVRMLLDIPVMLNNLRLDWSYISTELKKLQLYDFAAAIFCLCNKWFGIALPFDAQLDNVEIIEEYIIAGGVFGYENKNPDAIKINNEGRFKSLLSMIFPSYEKLSERYVWFKGTPKWLLPVGWVKFWWFRMVKNRENSLERVKLAMSNNEDAGKHKLLINAVGLNKD